MPSVLISTFRKKISSHSTIILILLAALTVGLIVLRFSSDAINPLFKEGFSLIVVFFFFTGAIIRNRKTSRLKALDPLDPTRTIEELESLIEKERIAFQKNQMVRVMVGTIVLILFLALLFFNPDSCLFAHAFVVFLGIILLTMLQGWTRMKDGMMLQDIKHALRDQPSDIS